MAQGSQVNETTAHQVLHQDQPLSHIVNAKSFQNIILFVGVQASSKLSKLSSEFGLGWTSWELRAWHGPRATRVSIQARQVHSCLGSLPEYKCGGTFRSKRKALRLFAQRSCTVRKRAR